MTTPAPRFTVTVCYATARQEILRTLEVEQGATIATAITASGVLEEMAILAAAGELGALADPRDPGHAGFDPAVHLAGIFGKKKPLDTLLRPGDRVELYRPLLADPKESRRRRAGGKKAGAA
jgi:putative ubiquitin-RnfH superfamily antitoxin RatB of RatAB toxin-antitoxin module